MTAALAQAGWHAAACADTAMPTGLSAVAPAGWPHRRAVRLCSLKVPAQRVDPDIRANASTALLAPRPRVEPTFVVSVSDSRTQGGVTHSGGSR